MPRRGFDLARALVVGLALALMLTACAVDVDTSAATVVAPTGDAAPDPVEDPQPTWNAVDDIASALERAASSGPLRFRQVVTVTDDEGATSSVRQGVYLPAEQLGYGEFKPAEPAVGEAERRLDARSDADPDDSFEGLLRDLDERYRVTEGDFWLYRRASSGLPAWASTPSEIDTGSRLATLQALSVDPRFYLSEVGRAVVEEIDTQVGDDGSITSAVLFDGGVLGALTLPPLLFEQQANQPLTTQTVLVPGTIEFSADGVVRHVTADLDLWWEAFFSESGLTEADRQQAGTATYRSSYSLAIAQVDGTTDVRPPCVGDDVVAGAGELAGLATCACPVGGVPDGDIDQDRITNRRQVLQVQDPIAAGTTVQDIVDSPSSWLVPQAVPEDLVCDESFITVADLNDWLDFVVGDDIPVGALLESRHFVETASESAALAQVLVVTQTIPAGTLVSEVVDLPTFYLAAQAVPEELVADGAIQSIARLQELDVPSGGGQAVFARDVLPGEQLVESALTGE